MLTDTSRVRRRTVMPAPHQDEPDERSGQRHLRCLGQRAVLASAIRVAGPLRCPPFAACKGRLVPEHARECFCDQAIIVTTEVSARSQTNGTTCQIEEIGTAGNKQMCLGHGIILVQRQNTPVCACAARLWACGGWRSALRGTKHPGPLGPETLEHGTVAVHLTAHYDAVARRMLG